MKLKLYIISYFSLIFRYVTANKLKRFCGMKFIGVFELDDETRDGAVNFGTNE